MTGSIYIAQGHSILKVGRSKNPKSRKYTLQKEFEKFGDSITNFRIFEVGDRACNAELHLLRKTSEVRNQFAGREWFVSGDFNEISLLAEQAVSFAKSLGPVPNFQQPNPSEIAKRNEERRLLQERKSQRKVKREIQQAKLNAKKRMLRVLRSIQVDCIAMWSRKGLLRPVQTVATVSNVNHPERITAVA